MPEIRFQVLERNGAAGVQILKALLESCDLFGIAEDRKRLLKRFEVVRAHQHRRGPSIPGDRDAVVLRSDTFHEFREAVLDLGEGLGFHG